MSGNKASSFSFGWATFKEDPPIIPRAPLAAKLAGAEKHIHQAYHKTNILDYLLFEYNQIKARIIKECDYK
jgi:hypothetical protein